MKTPEQLVDALLSDHSIQTSDGWTSHDAEQLALDAIEAYKAQQATQMPQSHYAVEDQAHKDCKQCEQAGYDAISHAVRTNSIAVRWEDLIHWALVKKVGHKWDKEAGVAYLFTVENCPNEDHAQTYTCLFCGTEVK